MRVRRLECGSAAAGRVAKGCEQCARGGKMVLFVTGRCGSGCFYCPVSCERKGSDSVYANELRVLDAEEVLREAEMMDAEGTGITGGDPLLDMDRTTGMIRALKKRFGKGHHIHLYTSTVDPDRCRELAEAGLDEIRFHPSPEDWGTLGNTRIGEIGGLGMDVGIEVPALPGYRDGLVRMAEDARSLGVDFINLNELEFSEGNWDMMDAEGYRPRDDVSSAVMGSREVAMEVMGRSSVPIHFCSSSFKDSVQLRRRLVRRARHTAAPYDLVTDDGTLLKGILYADDLEGAARTLREEYGVPDGMMRIDRRRGRLETAAWILEEIACGLPFDCCITEEYPTADRLEVERIPLGRR